MGEKNRWRGRVHLLWFLPASSLKLCMVADFSFLAGEKKKKKAPSLMRSVANALRPVWE